MKKYFLVFIIAIFLLSSCGLEMIDEGMLVNDYIFPYVKFERLLDGNGSYFYTASIVKGAVVSSVYIPAFVEDSNSGKLPVKYFTGFESDDDIKNLKSTVFESSDTKIKLNSLNQAAILDTITYKNIDENTVWNNLPKLPHTDKYEFIGWYTVSTDEKVRNGDEMEKGKTKIYAKRAEIEIIHHEEVPSTCTEKGTVEYWECKNCGKIFSDKACTHEIDQIEIPSLGHSLVYIKTEDPTCIESGIRAHYECTRCHSLFEDEKATKATSLEELALAAYGHNWVYKYGERVVDGHWRECTRCHLTTDSFPHDYSIERIMTAPTHSKKGEKKYTCSLCGATKTEDIPPVGEEHKGIEKEIVAPTCEEQGYTIYECTISGCDEEYKADYTDPLGHSLTKVEAKEPTCTERGYDAYFVCSRCGKLFLDENGKNETTLGEIEIAPLKHLYSESDYKMDDNSHWHECTRCHAIIDKTIHSYTVETTAYQDKKATCTEPAAYFYTCVCGLKGTKTFGYGSPLGHEPVYHEGKEADCGYAGNVEYWQCSRCNGKFFDKNCTQKIEYDQEIIPATGNHTFGSYKSIGEEGHIALCKVCGKTYGDVENHTIDSVNWASDEETHWHKCEKCDYRTEEAEHTFVTYGSDEVCPVCLYAASGEEHTSPGGFDIRPQILEPEGTLKVNKANGSFVATFTLDENSEMTGIIWFLDGSELESKNTTCSFSAPESRTYHIMCVVFNGNLVNSFEQTILGGGTT